MLDRRSFLLASAATLIAGRSFADAAAVLPLWPGQPPGGGGPSGPSQIGARGEAQNVAMPTIEIVRPSSPNGAAMLVASGGGYKRIENGSEARPAANWLAARGITAFILTYRLPGEGWKAGPLAPLQDAQRAMRLIRQGAAGFGIDPARLGVLGFSAGGHLMGLTATRSAFASYPRVDAADRLSARPKLSALIYPVITLLPPYDRTSTRRVLIGDHPTRAEASTWSVETHVRRACPPMFLVQAADDPISNPRNTVLMQAACKAAGVPVEFHSLPSGGHGFGMGKPGAPSAAWPGWYEAWLKANGAL